MVSPDSPPPPSFRLKVVPPGGYIRFPHEAMGRMFRDTAQESFSSCLRSEHPRLTNSLERLHSF